MSKFNLSEKIVSKSIYINTEDKIKVSRVKEFIKLLKEDLFFEIDGQFYIRPANKIIDIIDKLAGSKFVIDKEVAQK